MIWDVFLDYLECPGLFGHVRKSRNHRKEGFEGPHWSKSKSHKFRLEQNNTTELLSISFPQVCQKKCPKLAIKNKHAGFAALFSGFSIGHRPFLKGLWTNKYVTWSKPNSLARAQAKQTMSHRVIEKKKFLLPFASLPTRRPPPTRLPPPLTRLPPNSVLQFEGALPCPAHVFRVAGCCANGCYIWRHYSTQRKWNGWMCWKVFRKCNDWIICCKRNTYSILTYVQLRFFKVWRLF